MGRKKMKKRIAIIIMSISIIMGIFTIPSKAVDEVENANTIQNTTIDKQEIEKSSNANLGNLGIRPHDFTGFKYKTTSYEVVVPEDTEEIEIYAKTQDASATVTGTGMKKLEVGENLFEVVVTAEDGATRKTYTLNVIREVVQEREEEEAKEENIETTVKGNETKKEIQPRQTMTQNIEQKEEKMEKGKTPIIILGAVLVVMLVIGAISAVVHQKNKKLEEEFLGEYELEEEEVPKALKGKRFQDEPKEEPEEDYTKMPKDKLKEEFLNGYTSQLDLDFEVEERTYQDNRRIGKHKGKRFK